VSAREAGGTTVMHENADEVCRSRGMLPPFSQRQFLFPFIPPLVGCFRIQDSMLIIFSGKTLLLLSPASPPTFCNFLARLERPPPSRVSHFSVYSGIVTRGLLSMRNSTLRLGGTGRPVEDLSFLQRDENQRWRKK
jgi:hypothetical protein